MKTFAKIIGALAGVLVVFAACGAVLSGGPSRPAGDGVGSDVPVAGQALEAPVYSPSHPPSQVRAAPEYPNVGESFQFDDGLIITLVSIEPYQPSGSAAGDDQERNVLVTTKIRNEGVQAYQFNDFVVGPTVTHKGVPASSITDLGKLRITPLTSVLPGREFTFTDAFSIGSQGEMQLEYKLEMWGDNAIFVTQY